MGEEKPFLFRGGEMMGLGRGESGCSGPAAILSLPTQTQPDICRRLLVWVALAAPWIRPGWLQVLICVDRVFGTKTPNLRVSFPSLHWSFCRSMRGRQRIDVDKADSSG